MKLSPRNSISVREYFVAPGNIGVFFLKVKPPRNFDVFFRNVKPPRNRLSVLSEIKVSWKFSMCSFSKSKLLEIFKIVAPRKKEQIFRHFASAAASVLFELVDFCFQRGTHEQLCVTKNGAK